MMLLLIDTNFTAGLVALASDIGLVVVVAGMLLCVARLLRGPHLADRAMAVDTLTTHLMALVILFMLRGESLLLFDGVLVLALLGFLTTVAFSQYILRPHVRPRTRRAGKELEPEKE